MDITNVKRQIECGNVKDTFIIFKGEETFIARQYYRAISQCLNKPIQYIDSLDIYENDSKNIFGQDSFDDCLNVYVTDKFEYNYKNLLNKNNLIIVTKKVEKDTESIYNNFIINVPDLEEWCIKDYVYSLLEGVDTKYLDWLIKNCKNNIDKIQNEIDKLICFEPIQRQTIFEDMLNDNAFSDITDKTIFDFTNALQKRDLNTLKYIYEDIDVMDVEDLGVVTILYKNFIKLLNVWGSKNPTPENTGLSSKQIYAIRKSPKVWNIKQLVRIISFLTNIDYMLKSGKLVNINIRDYIVLKILSM